MEYEFIPIVYPNKPDDKRVPSALPTALPTITSEVIPGQGLPFIASAPYVAPEPVAPPPPLPTTGVLVNPADTLVYHPLTELPATTTFTQEGNYSLPSLITTMGGDQSLYTPYTGATGASGKDWSLYPALQQVNISSFGLANVGDMSQVGNMEFAPNKTITGVREISITAGGFGSLTLNADGIQNAGDITGANSITIDDQVLTALPTALLLNGTPIATITDLPNIYQWANYPALSTIQMNAAGTSGPHDITGCSQYGFADGAYLASAQNPTSPANPAGTHTRMYVVDSSGFPTQNIIYSTDLSGGYEALGTYTGVPKWASFPPQANLDFNGKEITNINKITFNTAVPGLGGASINALNDLNFSYATALAGLAGATNVNNIAFWNPFYPGVPGSYVNLYSKKLSYNGLPENIFLATDTKFCAPSLYTSIAPGVAGGKIEALGANARTITINDRPCSASWSEYPCTEPAVNMNGHIIVACGSIDFKTNTIDPLFNLLSIDDQGYLTYSYNANRTRIVPPSTWSQFPATQDVNMGAFDLINTGRVIFDGDPNNILNTDGSTLQWRGLPVQTGAAPDSVANWANYNAVNNVNIPPAYALNINQDNTLFFYKDSHLNTNIYHGVETNLDNPDFISFPTTFQVGNALEPARTISMTGGALGFGVNSDTEVNIDAVISVLVNSPAVEIGGGAVTINPVGAALIDATDVNINGALLVELASSVITLNAPVGDLNFNALTSLWDVGALSFNAGVVEVGWGATTITTGIGLWTAPSLTFAGGNLNLGGVITTINSGTLNINNTIATAISSPVLQLNSAQTIVAAGRPLQTDIVEPTTTNSLAISGVDTLTGRTDTGMVQSEVKSITGHGSGMNLTNIANFETYSATNVLLQTQYFTGAYANIVLSLTSAQLAYTSEVKVWQYPNIPRLAYNAQIFGRAVNNSGAGGGVPVNIAGYLVINNLTNPAQIQLGTLVGIPYSVVTSVRYQGANFSFFKLNFIDTIINDGDPMRQGDSYQIQLYLINAQPTPATDTISVSDGQINMTISTAGGL